MINLTSIIDNYPNELKAFPRAILREYLQYKILSYVFESEFSEKLNFIGGTAIHILYDSQRFSEDLDFDNKNLSFDEFKTITDNVRNKLRLEGFELEESSFSRESTFHSKLRFPGIYRKLNLSGHIDETLMVKIDCEDQGINYEVGRKLIRKIDILSRIRVSPVDILLSQKITAFLNREQGRDLYDIFFLSSKTKPNYNFLEIKEGIDSPEILKQRLLTRFSEVNISRLVSDANRFLFFPERDKNIILLFGEFVENFEF